MPKKSSTNPIPQCVQPAVTSSHFRVLNRSLAKRGPGLEKPEPLI